MRRAYTLTALAKTAAHADPNGVSDGFGSKSTSSYSTIIETNDHPTVRNLVASCAMSAKKTRSASCGRDTSRRIFSPLSRTYAASPPLPIVKRNAGVVSSPK